MAAKKKSYYKIGEACKALDIQPYVLRYWETEFSVLRPDKSKSGQRVYSESDLGTIRRIKELLYEEGFTIAGAKKRLANELASGPAKVSEPATPKAGPTPAAKAPAETATTAKAPAKPKKAPKSAPVKASSKPASKSSAKASASSKKADPSQAATPDDSAAPELFSTEPQAESEANKNLDSGAAKEVEQLREGVRQALKEARELLAFVDSKSG